MSVNQCIFIGNLARDPETKTVNDKAVTNFTIGVNEKRKDGDHTEWVNVVAWGNTAEACAKYLSKGSKVFVQGKMQTRSWDDKEGNKKYKTEIMASNVQFLSPKKEEVKNVAEEIPF